MKNELKCCAAALLGLFAFSCIEPEPVIPEEPEEIPEQKPDENPKDDPGFIEAVPDTVTFTNAEFIYNGDDIGEATSDGWLVKLYTDMDIDETGAPIGPGQVVQILLNAPYNAEQTADPEHLTGVYSEMFNSGDFSAGTFVSGYLQYIDLPGERLEVADGTFYADLAEGSTDMDYDLIDEGAVRIASAGNGTYTIEGILVGNKYTKRYFRWSGSIEARDNAPEQTPNSTITQDIINGNFTQAILQDKGDCFYLGDNSYRCVLLYLTEPTVSESEYPGGRPEGNGAVLRLEMLVPWDIDINKDGIPAGTYNMTQRNPDTSIDKDKIVPGVAVPGLPDEFAAWKVSGSWYYELENSEWTKTYARIDSGSITVDRGENGSHTVTYDLYDCQSNAKRISGSTVFEIETEEKPEEKPVATKDNTYVIDGKEFQFGSVAVSNFGEYLCIAASPEEGVDNFDAIFEQDEYLYAAISPMLNGKEFDLMTETELFTLMSTLQGAAIESLAPATRDEISEGKCTFTYSDDKASVSIMMKLKSGVELSAKMTAEEPSLVVNENIIALDGENKPVRTAFYESKDGMTTIYLTPAGISYFEELEITTYYAYITLQDSQCDGSRLNVSDIKCAGFVNNLNGTHKSSIDTKTSGTVNVLKDPDDPWHFTVMAELDFSGTTLEISFDGNAISTEVTEVKESVVEYDGKKQTIKEVWLNTMPNPEDTRSVVILTEEGNDVCLTMPRNFIDGNAHGFSQSPYMNIRYNDTIFSKATGYSGTVTVGIDGSTMTIEATNYKNLKISYEGPFKVSE